MQALSINLLNDRYDEFMQTGRPSRQPRTVFGERLHAVREEAGLSQNQVAQKMGVIQSTYSDWERHPVALRPDQIEKLAKILDVSVEHLFGTDAASLRRGGPTGKARRVFEEVSKLPRQQQQHIIRVVEAFVSQHGNGHKKAA